MDPLASPFDPPRPPSLLARALRRVYAANPFYVISAALVLYAIQLAGKERGSWELLGYLGGYTALTAAAGVLVVRLGRVWDDARSIVLIVVGMLLVVSVGFDELAVKEPELLRPRLLAGLGVAVALFEAMLAGLGIRLGLAYRLPYHALLAAFYLYPILVSDLVVIVDSAKANKSPLAAAMGGWPLVIAALSLSLVPAARMGRAGIAGNGTPWPWPLFPWVAFVGVGVAAAMRAWLLCNAFYTGPGLDPFGAYLLIPLAFAAGVVALEAGLAERHAGVVAGALGAPLVALALAFPGAGTNALRDQLLGHLRAYAGVPVGCATAAAAVFYAYAWARGARRAELGFVGALVAYAFAGPGVLAPADLLDVEPAAGPIFAAGAYLVLSLAWARASWRVLGGAGLVAWGVGLGFGAPELDSVAVDQVLVRHGLTLASACVAALVATRALFEDRLARAAGWFIAPALTGLLVAALFDAKQWAAAWPAWLAWAYAAALVAAPAAYARLARHAPSAGLAGLHAAVFASRVGIVVVDLHRDPRLHPAVLPVFWSAACFGVGFAISMAKGGAFRALWARAVAVKGDVDVKIEGADALAEAPAA